MGDPDGALCGEDILRALRLMYLATIIFTAAEVLIFAMR